MLTFLFGAIVGTAAMWMWGDRIRARFGERVHAIVDRTLGVLDAVDDRLAGLRGRVESFATTPDSSRSRDLA